MPVCFLGNRSWTLFLKESARPLKNYSKGTPGKKNLPKALSLYKPPKPPTLQQPKLDFPAPTH